MSDQTPSLSNVPVIDFSKVIVTGLPGIGGLLSLNGDSTPAQILAAGGGITITPGPAGTNTIAGITLTNETVVNIADQPLIQLRAFINGVLDPGFTIDVPVPNSTEIRFQMLGFQSGNAGVVSDPGAAAATDYLGADNTFRPIPGGGGITSINGDATAAQVIAAGQGLALTNAGATHTLRVNLDIIGDFNAGGVALVNGVLTVCSTRTIAAGEDGQYLMSYGGGVAGIAAQFMDVVVRLNGAVLTGFGFAGIPESVAQDLHVTGSAGIVIFAVGDVFDVAIDHHGGGADTVSLAAWLQGIRIHA